MLDSIFDLEVLVPGIHCSFQFILRHYALKFQIQCTFFGDRFLTFLLHSIRTPSSCSDPFHKALRRVEHNMRQLI